MQMPYCFPASKIGHTYENVNCVTKDSANPQNLDTIEDRLYFQVVCVKLIQMLSVPEDLESNWVAFFLKHPVVSTGLVKIFLFIKTLCNPS